MNFAAGIPVKPVFSMAQMASLAFFLGPLGLGLSLALSLSRIGRTDLIKKVLLFTFLAATVEWILLGSGVGEISAVVLHLAGAILAKVLHDRWLFIPYRKQRSSNFSRGEFVLFFLGVLVLRNPYESLWLFLDFVSV